MMQFRTLSSKDGAFVVDKPAFTLWRVIALFAFLAFTVATCHAQTINNPGFETGNKSGWLEGGQVNGVNTTAPHTGTYNAYNNGGWNSLFQNVSGLKTNTDYTLKAWGRLATTTANSTHRFYVKVAGVEKNATITSTGYQQYSIVFNTGSNTSVELGEYEATGASSVAYFDDFALTENTSAPTGSGSITYEYWSNITGTSVSLIPTGTTPSGTMTLTSLEATINRADNFGSRIRGYLTAPTTGSYTFWLASDDDGQLKLSPNDQPAGATTIASITGGWTNSREWTKYPGQKSAAINLVAGQSYYIEVLEKEGGGGDNVAVGWAKPGQATTAPSEVIPGTQLSPFTGGTPTGDDPTKNRMGINILGVSDYFEDRLFADAMKQGRDFEKAAGGTAAIDTNGWPTEDFRLVVWHGIPNMNGTYKLRFTGQATSVTAGYGSASVTGLTYNSSTNTSDATLTYNSTDGAGLQLTFTGTKRTSGSATGTGLTNVQLMRPTAPGATTSYAFGTNFTTQIKNAVSKFQVIRFMDYLATNANIQTNWSDRPKPGDASQNRNPGGAYGWQGRGGAWEYAVALANETDRDMWICIPAKATDAYVTNVARLIRYGSDGVNPYTSDQASPMFAPLKPTLKVYVEYSNEVWNTGGAFQQSFQNHDAAIAEVNAGGSPLNFDGSTNDWYWAWRRVAKRGAEISTIFRSVFGDSAMMTRVRPVLESQLGYAGGPLAEQINILENYYNNPALVATPHPANYYFYGGGGSAYYNPDNNSDTLDLTNIWNSASFNPVSWQPALQDDINYIASFGLKRIAYEGGPSMDNTGHSESVKAAARDDSRMQTEITEHHTTWSQYGGDLLVYFNDAGDYEWGFTGSIFNLATPKYQGIDALTPATRATVTYGTALPASVDGNAFSRCSVGWKNPGTGALTMLGASNPVSWAGYLFRTSASGSYNVRVNYSSNNTGTLRVYFDGNLVGTLNVTAGASGVDSAAFPVSVQTGIHAVRVQCTTGPVNVNNVRVQ